MALDIVAPDRSSDNQLPFELTKKNDKFYACGVSDNKAPLLCWFNALNIYKLAEMEIPINIKFIIEGTSEIQSSSLANAINKNRSFFADVEYICMTIDKKVNAEPCLKYGYRGLCQFSLFVSCGEKKVHSGTYGGAFNQPMMDAVQIVGSIVDKNGKIAVTDVTYF